MSSLNRLVPQGAVLGAVMETALNSDQPGFARALTQRDVYSFDGSAILIPAGSRLIGQYKSGVAQGASRLFVLWTRMIRPDGVSIDLASPATDDLGRGGIGGKVNRHYLQRFGGAILTSVLSGAITAATASRSGGSTVFVGSANQATNLATQATQSLTSRRRSRHDRTNRARLRRARSRLFAGRASAVSMSQRVYLDAFLAPLAAFPRPLRCHRPVHQPAGEVVA
jgi:type IV secretion system protein VirB10